MTPRNDANALHRLLEALTEQDKFALHTRWAEVLECEFETPEFARRHAEVVALLNGSIELIAMLPASTAERFDRYVWRWWYAVIAPSHAWPNPVGRGSVLTQEALDQLASAGELIDSHLGGSTASPRSDNVVALSKHCLEWLGVLEEDDDLPTALRLALLHDLRHVLWLTEHVDLFGVSRAATAAQQAAGGLVLACHHVSHKTRPRWIARTRSLCGVLLELTRLFAATNAAIGEGEHLESTIAQLVAANDASPAADIVDAEVVDDDG